MNNNSISTSNAITFTCRIKVNNLELVAPAKFKLPLSHMPILYAFIKPHVILIYLPMFTQFISHLKTRPIFAFFLHGSIKVSLKFRNDMTSFTSVQNPLNRVFACLGKQKQVLHFQLEGGILVMVIVFRL